MAAALSADAASTSQPFLLAQLAVNGANCALSDRGAFDTTSAALEQSLDAVRAHQ
jgi:hypothetical protein